VRTILAMTLLLFVSASGTFADTGLLSASGKLDFRGIIPLNNGSVTEYPGLYGLLKVDTSHPAWRLHVWLEGGWDGSVHLPARNHEILKTYDRVYQSDTPFLEFKELYGAYSSDLFEFRAGVQRFAWGRLDEYPINDRLNPWDYTHFLTRPLEERKIGVPSLSMRVSRNDWGFEAAWVPVLVPYRLPMPNERWSKILEISGYTGMRGIEIRPGEPDLPPLRFENGSFGIRLLHLGTTVEWGINLFRGYDLQPLFKTTELDIRYANGKVLVNPGYVPDFHKMTSIGVEAAAVKDFWSLRAEAAYSFGRYFNTRWEQWGYPSTPGLGTFPLQPNEHRSDALDYGVGVDFRLFEDCLLTVQAQQTVIMNRPDTLYNRKFETLLWGNLKNGWMNQRLETNVNIAYNPEHNGFMARANVTYVLTDSWKGGVGAAVLKGDPQSLFGRFSRNDQIEANLVYSW